ncbi:hypothetical protein PTSG_11898 [Salpingoeca rosetta]|uniref:C-type lectin domain-containing protein n=1 Tax=Salpingoeca rosetta (strain ATCC 50818 / BSB-021) TaxID=946362 RepID=F2U2U7_SALR5|nr:uncharacterized protein PTSG_11898 [Salpingoeca rosetta]EGD81941.1 hypothetical protein PTSG_11898 [Salpingoeca rosetta]|eukprot:XP_004996124.1 hypothetical protein PTSG_11898 [Salpingoeca rosetta]
MVAGVLGVLVCLLLLSPPLHADQTVTSQYDQSLAAYCQSGEGIRNLHTTFDAGYGDRAWTITCQPVGTTPSTSPAIYFSSQFSYEDDVFYQCPDNAYLSAMDSENSNVRMDRRWLFACTDVTGAEFSSCYWMQLSDFEQDFAFDAAPGQAITGINSTFDGNVNDRMWWIRVCSTVCINGALSGTAAECIAPTTTTTTAPPWVRYGPSEYKFDDVSKVVFDDAEALCEQEGGTLAVILSQDEYDWVFAAALNMSANREVWLGGIFPTRGQLEWIDGSPVVDFGIPWVDGDPSGGDLEACLLFNALSRVYDSIAASLAMGGTTTASVGSTVVSASRVESAVLNAFSVAFQNDSMAGVALPGNFSNFLPDSGGCSVIDFEVRTVSGCNTNGTDDSNNTTSTASVLRVDELDSPIVFTFELPPGIPRYQMVAVFWNDTKRRENCTVTASEDCIGAWDTEGVSLMFPDDDNGGDGGDGSNNNSGNDNNDNNDNSNRRRRDAATTTTASPSTTPSGGNMTMVQVQSRHLRGRAYAISIDFTLEPPEVTLANFDPRNAPYVWALFCSLIGFVLLVLLYSWVELRAYEYREHLISSFSIPAEQFNERVWDMQVSKHSYPVALLIRFGWYLRSRHAWAAVILPQGISARPQRSLKVLALIASISMAVAMNSVFSYAAVKNPDKNVNAISITLNGSTFYVPLEGIYAFALTFPFFYLLSMAFARFQTLLGKLQQLAPELYTNRIPPLPVAEPLAATWAVSSIKRDTSVPASALDDLDVAEVVTQHVASSRSRSRSRLGSALGDISPQSGSFFQENEETAFTESTMETAAAMAALAEEEEEEEEEKKKEKKEKGVETVHAAKKQNNKTETASGRVSNATDKTQGSTHSQQHEHGNGVHRTSTDNNNNSSSSDQQEKEGRSGGGDEAGGVNGAKHGEGAGTASKEDEGDGDGAHVSGEYMETTAADAQGKDGEVLVLDDLAATTGDSDGHTDNNNDADGADDADSVTIVLDDDNEDGGGRDGGDGGNDNSDRSDGGSSSSAGTSDNAGSARHMEYLDIEGANSGHDADADELYAVYGDDDNNNNHDDDNNHGDGDDDVAADSDEEAALDAAMAVALDFEEGDAQEGDDGADGDESRLLAHATSSTDTDTPARAAKDSATNTTTTTTSRKPLNRQGSSASRILILSTDDDDQGGVVVVGDGGGGRRKQSDTDDMDGSGGGVVLEGAGGGGGSNASRNSMASRTSSSASVDSDAELAAALRFSVDVRPRAGPGEQLQLRQLHQQQHAPNAPPPLSPILDEDHKGGVDERDLENGTRNATGADGGAGDGGKAAKRWSSQSAEAHGDDNNDAPGQEETVASTMTREEVQRALIELHHSMNFWRRFCFALSALLILAGWALTLVFMGSVEREQQERWLKGCLEFVFLSAIITAPIVLLIGAIRQQWRLHRWRRRHTEEEWEALIVEEKQKTSSIAMTMTKAMLFTEIGRAVRANFDIYIL